MKRVFISAIALLVSMSLLAQETRPARGGGLAERFRQLDRSGDGKVSAEEFPARCLIRWTRTVMVS